MKKLWQTLFVAFAAPLCIAADSAHNLIRVRIADDVNGQVHHIGEARGTKAIVFVFLGPECPISQRYIPELNRIAAQKWTNAIEFYGVVSGASITRAQAARFTKDYAIKFPVVFDDAGQFARWLKPTHVPNAFVLKPDGDFVYRGRIDDWYESPGRPRTFVRSHELRDAISATLAGKAPAKIYAPPVGCYFEDWPANTSAR